MNDNINLCEILKDCPINTGFYSPLIGDCKLSNVNSCDVVVANSKGALHINPDATATFCEHKTVELMLFPSQTQQDWSKWQCPKSKKPKFDPNTLQPFDKIIVRDNSVESWSAALFSHIVYDLSEYDIEGSDDVEFIIATTGSSDFSYCIPFNDETKHLIGTTDKAPEYYRYWED